jgi:hypothetical protein
MAGTSTNEVGNTPVSEKEADAALRIANFRLERWKNRREHEWRISASLWTLMVAAIASLLSKAVPLPTLNCTLGLGILLALAAVVFVHAAFWVWPNWRRNQKDLVKAFYHLGIADRYAHGIQHPPDEINCRWPTEDDFRLSHMVRDGMPVFQICATCLLAGLIFASVLLRAT